MKGGGGGECPLSWMRFDVPLLHPTLATTSGNTEWGGGCEGQLLSAN